MEQINFVHLRLHTEFSLSDGLVKIPALMEKATTFGMPAVAVTDMGNLYATVKFYQAAFKAGIKPIIGTDIRIAHEEQGFCRATLFCLDNQGYKNLLKLISKSFLEGQSTGVPIIEKAWLELYQEGLILLAGIDSDFGLALLSNDKTTANACIKYWQNLFPARFYIEISRVGKSDENIYLRRVLKLAEKYIIPVVATNDVRFLEREDFEAHEARVCIQQGVTLADPHRSRLYTDQQHFRSGKEMEKLFADIPEALANTIEIAKRCNVTFTLGKNRLPHFDVPDTYTTESYLCEVAKQGLEKRLQTILTNDPKVDRKPYDDRITRELNVINEMGFAGYFLIVADFTRWSKENNIPVGPGRGSGPGSLVAYALNITDLDPIALELLFERFLNPERVSMPDFDIDFCMDGRDRVIEYVIETHGHDSVSQIITYGTMAAKAVVRDVGRVLGHNYGFVDKIAKLIPFELGITLDKAMAQEPLLNERYNQEEDVRTLIDLARKLEGVTRNVGKHAGGIVIAPGKLTDFVPLYCEPNETMHAVTQFDKDDVEAVGLVKFDFLGLKTLTIINRALRDINKNTAAPIDISVLPLNDEKSYTLLKSCQTTAVFQLESPGMRDLIKRLQPDCFEDVIALVALFRPGPLQAGAADDFINRKHGKAKIEIAHPCLEPILGPTYGAIVYQEQVMQIAQALAGYTLGSADILRKAMGKKKPEEMAKQRKIFCDGATQRGIKAETATQLFDAMEKFAGYGFNKSHSAAYALIAYQTAWLKAHHSAAFMAAVLSSDMDRTDKVIGLLNDCLEMKLHVSPPNINKSDYYFNVLDDKNIMYGLGAIKGVGAAAIENIVDAREQHGVFKDLFDFCQRVDLRKVNRRVLEALIKSGCFDVFAENRAMLMASLNHALQHAEQMTQNQTYGQHDLLSMMDSNDNSNYVCQYVDTPAWPSTIQLQGEKETLGFYLTGHPLNQYLKEISQFTTCRINELTKNSHNVRVAGMINNIRTRQTKRGDRLAIFKLDDGASQIEVVCFSEAYYKYRSLLVQDQIIVVEGEVGFDDFNNSLRIMGKDLLTLDHAREKFAKHLHISFNSIDECDIQHLHNLLKNHLGGSCQVVLKFIQDRVQADIRLGNTWLIKPSDLLVNQIQEYFPTKHIELVY